MGESSGLPRAAAVALSPSSKLPLRERSTIVVVHSLSRPLSRRQMFPHHSVIGLVGRGAIHAVRSMNSPSFGSRMADSVRRTVSENPVVIYSKSWCSYSLQVKSLFKRLRVEPLVIELDELGPQGPQLQKVLERLTGQYTVPNVFIGGRHVGGCTDTMKLYRSGALANLLMELKVGALGLPQA